MDFDPAAADKKKRKRRTKKDGNADLADEMDAAPTQRFNPLGNTDTPTKSFRSQPFGDAQAGQFDFDMGPTTNAMINALSQSLFANGINQEDIRKTYEGLALKDTHGFLTDPTSRLINAIETLRDCVQTVSGGKDSEDKEKGQDDEEMEEDDNPLEDFKSHNPDRHEVNTKVIFLKVSDISTVAEVYVAELFLQSKWREPLLDKLTAEELKEVRAADYWSPSLLFENMLSESKDNSSVVAERIDKYVWMVERRRVKGVFMQPLELKDFPFDVQDLTVTVTSEHDLKTLDIALDESEPCMVHEKTAIEQQEWKIHEHVVVNKRIITQDFGQVAREKPALSFVCRASRIPGYFYWNVFLIMFLITVLSFASYALPTKSPFSRLVLTFTLFLTSVTFKIVINQSLPKISYLTSLDKYVLMSMMTIVLISIWHCLVAVNGTGTTVFPTVVVTNEGYFVIGFAFVYAIMHLIFVLWVYIRVCARRRHVVQDDREFRTWLKKKLDWQNKQQAQAAADKANKKMKKRKS